MQAGLSKRSGLTHFFNELIGLSSIKLMFAFIALYEKHSGLSIESEWTKISTIFRKMDYLIFVKKVVDQLYATNVFLTLKLHKSRPD